MSSTPPSPQVLKQRLQGDPSTITQKAQTQTLVTCTHSREGKIIVLSADGTANKFGEKSTNVVEFHSRIRKNKKQITFYISGIGTHNPSPVGRVLDMAFANSFETNILIAYKWLAENYEEGDQIFMFGFSRGAYQVRVIAGMIERVGLIYPGSTAQLPDVFKLYMSTTERSANSKSEKYEKAMRLCRTFKAAFSQPDVKVHFVGVWDTVSSIGFSRGASLPETVSGMSHVCHFRHALALDERRVRFWPEHAHSQPSNSSEIGGDVKEVWFAGSHSDIGGGNTENLDLKTFGPALRWMTYEAQDHGLLMHPYTGEWALPDLTKPHSLKGAWHILEWLPLRRPSYEDGMVTLKPHHGAPRRIHAGQRIHESVYAAMGIKVDKPKTTDSQSSDRELPLLRPPTDQTASYMPYARLPNEPSASWRNYLFLAGLVEQDAFINIEAMIFGMQYATKARDLKRLQDEVEMLATNFSSGAGQNTGVLTEVHGALSILLSAVEFLRTVLRAQEDVRDTVIATLFLAMASLEPNEDHKLPLATFREVAQSAAAVLKPKHYPQVLGVLRHATDLLQVSYNLHEEQWIRAVAIPATSVILSAGPTKVMVQTGGGERSINIGDQWTVSFSADGSKFATGDEYGTVKIWDIATGKELRTFEGHSHLIYSLALSPDGCKLAAGSWDGTIRVWNTETGRDLYGAIKGHTSCVRGLAFSPDGTRLASGSYDDTVRLWDEDGKSKVLEGHSDIVSSVAFSKDHIISGSFDKTIRVWDAGSGGLVRVLRGHTNLVLCVAFSPDFKLVASGSVDCTARLWDVSSGEVLAIYDVVEVVWSIAFSFDGRQVVTGSYEGKVHVWNADVLL